MWDYKLFKREQVTENQESEPKRHFLLKKETWRERVSETTSRLLSHADAQRVNRLLEDYMNKSGDGIVQESVVDDFFKGGTLTASQALD
jgi:ribosomal protein L35